MRARKSVSARLDGELSELEAAGLDDHLRACADCSAFARQLHALGTELRAAPLEQPWITVFVPARRRPLVRLQTAAAAAAIVSVVAGSSFAVGRVVGVHGTPGGTQAATATSSPPVAPSLQADVVSQHMLAMLRRLEPAGELRVGRVTIL